MNRSESNSKRTQIKKHAINKNAIRTANKHLGEKGLRICRYTGEILKLNANNFNKLSSDKFGFQSVSKLGLKLYRDGKLEVKATDKPYQQHNKSKKVTTA